MTHPTGTHVPGLPPTGTLAGTHALGKSTVTVYGQRHWERLVALTVKQPGDDFNARLMADALAALVSEVTPLHRTNLAAEYLRGAKGRMQTYTLPPGLPVGDYAAQQRWAALVFLDCVDQVGDRLGADHDIYERLAWRHAAEAYTRGCENYRPAT
jgi:hypothetical protein